MKKLLLSLLLLVSLGCAHEPVKWDKTELGMATSLAVIHSIDGFQTSNFKENGLSEANPIVNGLFGDHPAAYGIGIYKLAIYGVQLAIAHYVPETNSQRKWFLGALNGVQLGVVVWNECVSARVNFPF